MKSIILLFIVLVIIYNVSLSLAFNVNNYKLSTSTSTSSLSSSSIITRIISNNNRKIVNTNFLKMEFEYKKFKKGSIIFIIIFLLYF